MKKIQFLVLSLWLPVAILAADTNPPPRLTVELRDGSRVVGTSVENKLKFHSALLGDLKLDVKDIRAVESVFTNAVKLTTANGDTLTGSFVGSELAIKTSFGKANLKVNSVRNISVAAGGPGTLPTGLVALWSGEGDAHDSVGGNHGQLVNGVGFAPGKVGQAFSLNENANGNDGYPGFRSGGGSSGFFPGIRTNRDGGFVLIPASPALDVGAGDGFTIAAWIKPATISREMLIAEYEQALGTFNGADVGVDFAIQRVNGAGGWCLYANIAEKETGHELVSPPNLLMPGVWQHVALCYDKASGAAGLYLNGAVVAQAVIGSVVPRTDLPYLLLGGRTTFGSVVNPRSTFSGRMDEIGIYNRALTAAEIRAVFEAANKN